jgi:hypothetical protein
MIAPPGSCLPSPTPAGNEVTAVGRFATAQCQKPDTVGASGSGASVLDACAGLGGWSCLPRAASTAASNKIGFHHTFHGIIGEHECSGCRPGEGGVEQDLVMSQTLRRPAMLPPDEIALYVVPSTGNTDGELGLFFREVPHGRYDRGNSATNAIEAKQVANAVLEHATRHPELSLGVAAFSVAQRDADLGPYRLRNLRER